MKKVILFFIILLLSACGTGDRYNFSGSTDNWEVFYVADISDIDEQNATGTIKYIGPDSAPESISYLINTKPGKAEGINLSLEDGIVQLNGVSCSGCAIVQENQEIEVTISWIDSTETIILKNK